MKNQNGKNFRGWLVLILLAETFFTGQLQADDSNKGDYKSRWKAVLQSTNLDEFEKGTRALIKDFPDRPNGYCDMMMLIEHNETTNHDRAISLAREMTADSVPEKFRLWGKGCLNRLSGVGKPVEIRFTAVDGREIDLAKMTNKVVLVDFWATTCSPCVAELPQIKAAYDKFHGKGFEVIGISCDQAQQVDQKKLEQFLKRKELPWPQYYDGKQQTENKFGQSFGIDGIPHLLLIDKKWNLCFDHVKVKELDKKITALLSE